MTHRGQPPQMPVPIDITNVQKYSQVAQGQNGQPMGIT